MLTTRRCTKWLAAQVGPPVRYVPFAVCLIVLFGDLAIAQAPRLNQRGSPNAGIIDSREFAMTAIRGQCIEFAEAKRGDKRADIRDCAVSEFGEFGTVDGQTYYYAIYCLIPNYATDNGKCGDDSFSGRYYRQRGLAIFARVAGEIGTLVYPEKPQIIQNAAGTLLYLPVAVDGTAHDNASQYYLRQAGGWEPIEALAWLGDLRQRIPAAREILKGVWPDLRTMRAEAGLYRSGDANCCPSGGTARIRLAIRSKQLVIDSVVVEEAR